MSRPRASQRWISEDEEFGSDPTFYRSEWRARIRLHELEAQRRRRRAKAALLAAVVLAAIALVVVQLTGLTPWKAIGLRLAQALVIVIAGRVLWLTCEAIDAIGKKEREEGKR